MKKKYKLMRRIGEAEMVYSATSEAAQEYNPRFTTTTFFDVDGTLSLHSKNAIPAHVAQYLERLTKDGHQIVLTSARDEEWLNEFKDLLNYIGIPVHATVPFCGRGARIVVNDRGDNKLTSAAVSIETFSDSMDWVKKHEEVIKTSKRAYGE